MIDNGEFSRGSGRAAQLNARHAEVRKWIDDRHEEAKRMIDGNFKRMMYPLGVAWALLAIHFVTDAAWIPPAALAIVLLNLAVMVPLNRRFDRKLKAHNAETEKEMARMHERIRSDFGL